MKRRGIFALCLLASIIMFGCASTSVESSSDVVARIAKDSAKREEFELAIKKGNMRKVARLIKKSSFEQNRDGLGIAIRLNSIETVRVFLKAGVDVNSARPRVAPGTPLIEACSSMRYDIAKLLLEEGVDVNIVDFSGSSALVYAIDRGRSDMVRLLMQYGADVNMQYKGRTLLYRAQVHNKDTSIANLLRNAGAKPAEQEELAIQKAIEAEKLKKQKEAEIAKLKENLKRGSDNFYKEVIYRRGTPIKTGDEFLIDKNRIEVLDRTTSQAGYTYLVTYYSSAAERGRDHAYSFMGGGAKYCFYIVSKREIALHQNYSFTNKEQYVTSVNDLKLTCIGKGKYQRNYQDVECYVFTLDAEL